MKNDKNSILIIVLLVVTIVACRLPVEIAGRFAEPPTTTATQCSPLDCAATATETPRPTSTPPPTGTPTPTSTSTPTPTITPTPSPTPLGGGYGDLFYISRSGEDNFDVLMLDVDAAMLSGVTVSPTQISVGLDAGVLAVSPDGLHIAVTDWTWPRGGDVLLFSISETTLARGRMGFESSFNLTAHLAADNRPTWSPAGDQIAFATARDYGWEVYAINADGTGSVNLTNHPALDSNPAWSPDGSRIAFYSDRDGDENIYVMAPDGSSVVQLTNHSADDYDPAWSPDGRYITFVSERDGNAEIYVLEFDLALRTDDGSAMRRLTNDPGSDRRPAWSPDGEWIAFDSIRDDLEARELYLMRTDGSQVARLTFNERLDIGARWRPIPGTKPLPLPTHPPTPTATALPTRTAIPSTPVPAGVEPTPTAVSLGEAIRIVGFSHIHAGEQATDWNSDPPTSGQHYSIPAPAGFYEEAILDEHVVHSLEHGYVILYFNCELKYGTGEAARQACDELWVEIAYAMQAAGVWDQTNTPKMIVLPRPEMENFITYTSWGRLYRVDDFHPDEYLRYVELYRGVAPEPRAP